MAYDEELAGRIRQLFGNDPELTEQKMFGGLVFMIRGNMAIASPSRERTPSAGWVPPRKH